MSTANQRQRGVMSLAFRPDWTFTKETAETAKKHGLRTVGELFDWVASHSNKDVAELFGPLRGGDVIETLAKIGLPVGRPYRVPRAKFLAAGEVCQECGAFGSEGLHVCECVSQPT